MVPGEIGIIPEQREVIGTPREVYGPYWALVERRGKEQGGGRPALEVCQERRSPPSRSRTLLS